MIVPTVAEHRRWSDWPRGCRALGVVLLAAIALGGCSEPSEFRFGGYIEAEKIEVGSRVGGRVAEVFVEEGDEVPAGLVLVRFETVQLEAELTEATHRKDRLETTLEKLIAGPRHQEIEKATHQLAIATSRLKQARSRHKRGLEQGAPFIAPQELEEQKTAVDIAEAEEQARKLDLELLQEGTRAEDITIARRALDESSARIDWLADQLKEGEVSAPVEADVEVFDLEPGDLVPAGSPVATLVRRNEIWIRCFVPATYLSFIKAGQKVDVEVDARSGQRFEGQVLRINRVAEYTPRNVQTYEQREDQVFGVKVRVEDPENLLRSGMAATVLIPRPAVGSGKKE